jgi:predicted anti-sigma-YlaC factor YlaD
MTPACSAHLSDEAFDDVLIGMASPESEAHLSTCQDCRCRVNAFRSDVALFNSASMAWTESQPVRMRATARKVIHHTRLAFVSWAGMAVVLAVMAVAILHHHGPVAPPSHATANVLQPADTQAQIAQDNQFLQAVNAAISPDEESPIDQYKLFQTRHSHMKTHHK